MKSNKDISSAVLSGSLVVLFFASAFFLVGLIGAIGLFKNLNLLKTDNYSSFILFFTSFLNFTLFAYLINIWFFIKSHEKSKNFFTTIKSYFFIFLPLICLIFSFFFIKNIPISYESFGLTILKFTGFGILINVFPILVLQRYTDLLQKKELPCKKEVAVFTKSITALLIIISLISLCSGFKIDSFDILNSFFKWSLKIVVYFIFLVLIELSFRAITSLIIKSSQRNKGALFSNNYITQILFDNINPLSNINKSFKKHFGIDLSKSWAIRFFYKAGLKLFTVLVLIAWLVTGMTSLSINERGVYERFGRVEKVFKPGLHLHLPWPFGNVKRIDYGVEKRLFLAQKATSVKVMPQTNKSLLVESKTTKWEDRLWETSHGREVYFLSASSKIIEKQGKKDKRGVRPYEMTNADIVIHFRTGLRDIDAIAACYSSTSPKELVLRQAKRWVQTVFASSTPENLIGSDRKVLGEKMLKTLQKEMDILNTGIEITGIYFEAIHPPIEAATSFYDVQAAIHDVKAQVSFANASAKRVKTSAQIKSASIIDSATADAQEIISRAIIETRIFMADNDAFKINPKAYKTENYLNALTDISALKELFIVDENLPIKQGFHIDFRKLTNEPVKIMAD